MHDWLFEIDNRATLDDLDDEFGFMLTSEAFLLVESKTLGETVAYVTWRDDIGWRCAWFGVRYNSMAAASLLEDIEAFRSTL